MKRVLLVDDAGFIRNILKTMLEENGYEVVGQAENGSVAVEKYKELRPDVVLMDIIMPEMDGIQALKKIIEIDKNAKVIIVSSIYQEAVFNELDASGAAGFIKKPFQADSLMETLNRAGV